MELQGASAMARQLHRQGFSVIPLGSPRDEPSDWFVGQRCSGDYEKARQEWPKAPRVKWKDYQHRVAPPHQLENWATRWPHANWAIVTGQSVVVVDADSDQAVSFMESGQVTRSPVRVRTRQGKHYYYATNPRLEIRNSARKNRIDIRGQGGFVVAPGSVHFTGTIYQWEFNSGFSVADIPDRLPALSPNDLLMIDSFNGNSSAKNPSPAQHNTGHRYSMPCDGRNLAEGEGRNNAAASLTGQLIRQGCSLQDIKTVLDTWNEGNQPPLSAQELNTTIASITRTHLNNYPASAVPVYPTTEANQLSHQLPAFGFVSAAELLEQPAVIEWLVQGVLEADSLAVMFGEPGSCKSFLALDLACCIATGTDWHGCEIRRQGAVFYIAGEGHNGIARRLQAWQQEFGVSLHRAPLHLSRCAASFIDHQSARLVSETVEYTIRRTGDIKPVLVVIDTLARNFGAGDENSTREMNLFITHIDQLLRIRYGCCVLVIHHSGVSDKTRARGNSALKGALDAEYAVQKDKTSLSLTAHKMKDAPEPDPMTFELVQVSLPFCDEKGVPQTSCVLKLRRTQASDKPQHAQARRLGKAQETALAVLRQLCTNHHDSQETGIKNNSDVQILLHDWREACVGKNRPFTHRQGWHRARDALIDKKRIAVEGAYVRLLEGTAADA